MKWFHKAPAADSAKPDGAPSGAKRRKRAKPDKKNVRAGARVKRAPAKKHILRNRVRALFGKAPVTASTPPRRTRLFTQLVVSFACIILVTVFIAGTLNATLVRNYVQDSSMRTLLARATDISKLMVRPGGSLKVINVQQLDEWERFTDAQVILINTDMTLITRQTLRNRRLTVTRAVEGSSAIEDASTAASSDQSDTSSEAAEALPDGAQILSAIDYELVSRVLAGNTVSDVRQFDFMDGTWAFAGAPIISGSHVDGAVLLCQPLSQISDISRNISFIMLIAVSVTTVFAIILSLLLTQRTVQPIAAMTRTALRMAGGNYGERVTIPTTAEIAQLGESLNLLSGNLSTTIRSLNQEKVKMELVLSAAVKLLELQEDDAQLDVYQLTERSPLIAMLIQVLETGEGLSGGWKNGAGQSVAATVSPIRMGDDLMGAVGLVRDVSEAERLEQLRRDYVANISHELRTPLTGIRGMVEPLIDGVYETEQEKQECYQIIYQETRRLERLITDMLDISRLQDGRIHIELEEMQIHGILEAAARRLERRASDEGVRLRVEPGPDPVVLGNEDRIMQVLIILIDNALKFTPSGGSVTLRTRIADGMLWISVRDTGAGIAKEDLPYIFERFYKADKSRMETRGTGLGLAIARLVVELMGGTIWCESEVGRGSSFEFAVQLAQAEDAAKADLPNALPEPDAKAVHEAVDNGDVKAVNAADKPKPAPSPVESGDVPESVKAQAQIREVAAAAGVEDENIEFDELLEMLLNDGGKGKSSDTDGNDQKG